MGGIKNKLSKLSNKVKNLLTNSKSLPVKGGQMTKSSGGLTIPLSDYCLTSPFSQRGTKLSLPLTKGRQMSVAHRWGRIAKYTSLTCLTLAIISTITLNIISSYSTNNIESNAEPVGNVSTLANDSACDPANTNAASCISLSITSSSSSTSTGGDDANLSLQIPREGGIATGRHTVTVNSNNYTGYYVMLTGNANGPAMLPATSSSNAFIQSTSGALTNPSALDKGQWGSWGIALPNSSLYTGFNTNEADYASTNQDVLSKTTWAAVPSKEAEDSNKTIIKTTTQSKKTDTYPVYYGVRVDSPVSVPADTYTAQVVYTATTNEVPVPTIDTLSKNSYELGSGASGQITISGTNLGSTYEVYLTNTNGDRVGECTNLNVIDDSNISCTIPTTDITAESYTIHVVTQGGEETASFTYTKPSSQSIYDQQANIRVDFDKGMIPVKYNTSSEKWEVVTDKELDSNLDNWFDYDTKKWANAVTVTKDSQDDYYRARAGSNEHYEVNDNDILGFWAYIPRYAYQVMRRDANNTVVQPTNFNIVFETKDTPKKTPIECLNGDYQICVKNQYGESRLNYPNTISQDDPLNNQTAWATHPAFTWEYTQAINGFDQTTELNGFWIGKFETTGSTEQPTVLPNQKHISKKESGNIGDYYDIAKSIGISDLNNTYGNTASTNQSNQNNNNLAISTSHMLKNSEWGAVAYLSASRYGAGVNEVQINGNHANGPDDNGDFSRGVTGCGPQANNDENDYSTVGTIGTNTACGSADKAYNGTLGQYASTTNNVYGVYDMSGGAWEYVMGSYTSSAPQSSTSYFANAARPPYVDLYPNNTFTNNDNATNNNQCTWATCGGHALHEVKSTQLATTSNGHSAGWDGDYANFVYFNCPWFVRGSTWDHGSDDGKPSVTYYYPYHASDHSTGFRIALLVMRNGQ